MIRAYIIFIMELLMAISVTAMLVAAVFIIKTLLIELIKSVRWIMTANEARSLAENGWRKELARVLQKVTDSASMGRTSLLCEGRLSDACLEELVKLGYRAHNSPIKGVFNVYWNRVSL